MSETQNGTLPAGHWIVCGLGHVGYRCASLLARLGERGVVVSRDIHADWRRGLEPSFSMLEGDARDEAVLLRAGIREARSILIVTGHDLTNVSIALDARRLNSGIRIVTRMFDRNLAEYLEKAVRIDRVLSASAFAAPAFVTAALGENMRGSFEADGRHFILEDCVADAGFPGVGRSIRDWTAHSGQAVIAARAESPGGEALAFDRDAVITPGARLTVLRQILENPDGKKEKNSDSLLSVFFRLGILASGAREWWRSSPAALRVMLIALLAVVLFSVALFHNRLNMPWVDSLYFVVTTITTVGYGDYNLQNASPSMKLFGAFLMLCGAAIIGTLFGILTSVLLETRLRDVLASGCARLRGHIIVAGGGSIGYRVAKDLASHGETVVTVESRQDGPRIHSLREFSTLVIGDALTDETLRRAGIAGAKALVAVTDNDLANLSISLAVKKNRPDCRAVARLFDSRLAAKMPQCLGIDAVFSVSAAAAPAFVGAAFCPGLLLGAVLDNRLALIFHRVLDGTPESSPANDAMETIFFVKHPGHKTFSPLAEGELPRHGDAVIGVQWRLFSVEPPQP